MDRIDALTRLKLACKTLETEQKQAVRDAEQERVPMIAAPVVRPNRLWRTSGRDALWKRLTGALALVLALRRGEDPDSWFAAEAAVNEALEAYRRRHEQ